MTIPDVTKSMMDATALMVAGYNEQARTIAAMEQSSKFDQVAYEATINGLRTEIRALNKELHARVADAEAEVKRLNAFVPDNERKGHACGWCNFFTCKCQH